MRIVRPTTCSAAIVLLILISQAVSVASPRKVWPRDDARTDQGLAAVRHQLRRAVAQRDPSLLLPVLGPEVRVDQEKTLPRELVPAEWAKRSREDQATFWRDLRDALDLGFARQDADTAFAPYLFVTFESEDGELAISAANVNVHGQPQLDAPVIAHLSYDIVKIDPHADRAARWVDLDGYRYLWRGILTPSGASGWVPDKYARYKTGPTFVFKRLDGVWKLTAFVIGD
jgi:hypothetical protein